MGIGSIMQAKRLLLLATGMSKADVVKRMLYGDISPRLPASVLRLHRHADVIITKDIGEYITYDKKENK
jgi:glucosamine-6-phosphate deaminase